MDLIKAAIKQILYPSFMCLRGRSKRIAYHKFIKKNEYKSIAENKLIQQERLFNIVDYSIKNIPYYIDFAKKNNFSYSKESIYRDIKKLPVMTKDMLKANFNQLYKINKKGFYYNTSGGSTGVPVKLIQDRRYLIEDATLYGDSLSNYEIGDRLIRLWGSERDIIEGSSSIMYRIANKIIFRTKYLNSFRMSEDDMKRFIDTINEYKPVTIIAYVQSIYELACFIERNGYDIFSPKSIITSAGTLYPDFREKIEKVCKCGVFNRYGSREVGNMAVECDKHEGMHLILFNHYIEILDSEGNDVKDGEMGEIVVTLLTNYTMPLLRFRIGDMAVPSSRKCSCGRGLPLIERVVGRTVNVFKNVKGELIDGEYFTHLFYFVDFIKKFQVVQESFEAITIRLEVEDKAVLGKNKSLFDEIDRKIRIVMGENCKITYKIEDEILPMASGKYVYTISNI